MPREGYESGWNRLDIRNFIFDYTYVHTEMNITQDTRVIVQTCNFELKGNVALMVCGSLGSVALLVVAL